METWAKTSLRHSLTSEHQTVVRVSMLLSTYHVLGFLFKTILCRLTFNPGHTWMNVFVCVCVLCMISPVLLFSTPWTVAHQAPLSMEFPSQEYWSGLPFPPPGGLPDPGMEPVSLASPALTGRCSTTAPPGKSSWMNEELLLPPVQRWGNSITGWFRALPEIP